MIRANTHTRIALLGAIALMGICSVARADAAEGEGAGGEPQAGAQQQALDLSPEVTEQLERAASTIEGLQAENGKLADDLAAAQAELVEAKKTLAEATAKASPAGPALTTASDAGRKRGRLTHLVTVLRGVVVHHAAPDGAAKGSTFKVDAAEAADLASAVAAGVVSVEPV